MSLEAKAKELAQLLKETDEYKDLTSAQTRIKLDPTAEDLVQQMQAKQQEIHQLQQQGKEPSPDQVQQIQFLDSQVKSNLTLTNFVKAQEAFSQKMNEVNNTIGKELFGTNQ